LEASISFVAVESITSLLSFSFASAAGAMLALIVVEMLPRAYSGSGRAAPTLGAAAGVAPMLALTAALGV
jgi:zinc transporter ZupT